MDGLDIMYEVDCEKEEPQDIVTILYELDCGQEEIKMARDLTEVEKKVFEASLKEYEHVYKFVGFNYMENRMVELEFTNGSGYTKCAAKKALVADIKAIGSLLVSPFIVAHITTRKSVTLRYSILQDHKLILARELTKEEQALVLEDIQPELSVCVVDEVAWSTNRVCISYGPKKNRTLARTKLQVTSALRCIKYIVLSDTLSVYITVD